MTALRLLGAVMAAWAAFCAALYVLLLGESGQPAAATAKQIETAARQFWQRMTSR